MKTTNRLDKVAAKDTTRYAIRGVAVYRTGGKAYAAATNGRMAVRVPVELDATDDVPDGGPCDGKARVVPAKVWAQACKRGHVLELNGQAKARDLAGGAEMAAPFDDSPFPDVEGAIPPKGSVSVCLNPKFLLALAEAMESTLDKDTAVVLHMDPDKAGKVCGAIRVEPVNGSGAVGVIMPITH